jgi:hypothetical protein
MAKLNLKHFEMWHLRNAELGQSDFSFFAPYLWNNLQNSLKLELVFVL